MDGHQFDQLARAIGTGASRRRVLGMFSAGVAALAAHLTVRDASAGCPGFGAQCDGECCQGFVCDPETFTCGFACADIGEPCGLIPAGQQPTVECCTGFCNQQGVCEEEVPVCGDENDLCFDPRVTESGLAFPCCNGGLQCIDGMCQFPEPECGDEGDYCGAKSNECCNEGLECIDDYCAVPPCGEVGDTELECCDGLICVDGACAEPEPECIELGDACGDGDTCCDDRQECIDGTCQFPCTPTGENCEFSDCCDPNATCIGDGVGVCTLPDPDCIGEGDTCEADTDCCTGICCGGACRDIECCVDDENPNDRCDEGTSCFEGVCEGISELCEEDADCDDDDTCCCDDGSCSEDCCDDEEEVTQLPNTGSGKTGTGVSGWLGAAAIGAAAAFLGGKKLQPQEQPAPISED